MNAVYLPRSWDLPVGLTIWPDHRGHGTPVTGYVVLVELSSNAVGLDTYNMEGQYYTFCVAHEHGLATRKALEIDTPILTYPAGSVLNNAGGLYGQTRA